MGIDSPKGQRGQSRWFRETGLRNEDVISCSSSQWSVLPFTGAPSIISYLATVSVSVVVLGPGMEIQRTKTNVKSAMHQAFPQRI